MEKPQTGEKEIKYDLRKKKKKVHSGQIEIHFL